MNHSLIIAHQAVIEFSSPGTTPHMWAYAEVFGLTELISEDFQHDRMYGRVRAVNPFR